jgi:phosphotransferase system  glucose/maltose/N-acetylglucosamine-specific IIC component
VVRGQSSLSLLVSPPSTLTVLSTPAPLALAQIRSGCLFAFLTAWGVISLGLNEIISWARGRVQNKGGVNFLTYVVACSVPTVLGVEAATSALMIFIPLTGRIGEKAPAELIVANVSRPLAVWNQRVRI